MVMRLKSRFLCVRVPARSRRLLSQRLIPPLHFGGRVQLWAFCIVDNNGSITQNHYLHGLCSVSTTILLFILNVTFKMSVPTITALCMKPSMTLFTETDQIIRSVSSAFGQGLDVMHLFNRNIDPVVKALFAERVRLRVLFSDTLPLRSVASFCFGLSVIAFVSLVLGSLMFIAVPTCCQLWAAGVAARFLWFSGHNFSPRCFGYKKGPAQLFAMQVLFFEKGSNVCYFLLYFVLSEANLPHLHSITCW